MTVKSININFAHANGFPAQSYRKMFAAFPDHFHVVAKDKYAHDHRFPLVDHWRNQVDELIEFVENQNLDPDFADRPTYAVGHSFGAVLSYLACCKRPELFKGLIMLDPPLITGPASMVFQLAKRTKLIDKITPAGLSKIRRRTWHINNDLVKYFKSKALFKNFDDDCIRDYINAVMHQDEKLLRLNFEVQVEADIFRTIPTQLSKHYGQLSTSAFLVTGKDSKVCIPKLYKRFLKGNPSMRHTLLDRGGHMYPLEHPKLVAKTISDLITV